MRVAMTTVCPVGLHICTVQISIKREKGESSVFDCVRVKHLGQKLSDNPNLTESDQVVYLKDVWSLKRRVFLLQLEYKHMK